MALAKALPAWSWHRAYMDVFTASFDGHPEAEFSSTMSIRFPTLSIAVLPSISTMDGNNFPKLKPLLSPSLREI
jgi:hypothetical protein